MNITRMKTIEEILTLVPWEYEIQEKGRIKFPIQKLLLIIRDHIDDEKFVVLLAHEDGQPKGFCIAFILNMPVNKSIYILRMYGNGLVEDFLNELTKYGKEFGVRKISFTIQKNTRSIERKYGFKQISVNMEREI